jgi:hypothetical protein
MVSQLSASTNPTKLHLPSSHTPNNGVVWSAKLCLHVIRGLISESFYLTFDPSSTSYAFNRSK